MTRPAPDAPIETRWEGRYITVQQQGTWAYVSRARGLPAAVILALEEAPDGRHVILVEHYRVALKRHCLALPAGLVEEDSVGVGRALCWHSGGAYWEVPVVVRSIT